MSTRTRKNGSTPEPETECPLCGGYGYTVDEQGLARACACGVLQRRQGIAAARRSGIPQRFATKDFGNFQAARGDRIRENIRKAAYSYASTFERTNEGLLLRGITGCGKTHIAIAILREVMARGFTGQYANLNDLLSRLRDSYSEQSGETEGGLLEEVDSVDLLVLDDVGAESATDWVRDRLYLIVNRRYENGRAVIITTNCDEAELEQRIGARTASRLYEMCGHDFPEFPREDWRRANFR